MDPAVHGGPLNQENKLDETTMFAIYGRKQVELDNLNEQYDKLLSVLAKVVVGEINIAQVAVDLTARSWAVTAPAAPAAGEEEPGQLVQ